jgi:predicted amidohydrolase YtcJ
MSADLVLRGGRVFTGRASDGLGRAVAIGGGQVLAVGHDDLADLVGPRTRVVDLRGRLVVPGLHDAHTHLLGGALTEEALDLREARCDDDLARPVAARIAERGAQEWVLGRGWDADLWEGGRWPGRAALDAVAPRTPVLLRRRDGHAALCNGAALRLAGITRDTPDPPGGALPKHSDGEPTGLLLEDPALELVSRLVPPASRAAQERALERLAARCARLGITSVQDDPSFDEALAPAAVYAKLLAAGKLPLRVQLWRRLGRAADALASDEAALAASGAPERRVAFGLLKGYLDGSLGSRTALLFQPYCDAPSAGTGIPVTPPELLVERARAAHRRGHQVGLHAIGDRAAALALDVFEAVAASEGLDSVRARRHRIEHAQLVRPEDVARLGRLCAVASVQPIHLASDLRIAESRLGAHRCASCGYPWRSFADREEAQGSTLAFGTDYPVEPLDPLPNLACAVSRRSPREPGLPPTSPKTFEPNQAVSLAEALEAYTSGSARACHREAWLGQLAPGFAADLAVFSADLFELPPSDWPALRCDLTVVDGQVVWEAVG